MRTKLRQTKHIQHINSDYTWRYVMTHSIKRTQNTIKLLDGLFRFVVFFSLSLSMGEYFFSIGLRS